MKFKTSDKFLLSQVRRSRKGAWIEIVAAAAEWRKPFSRSRKGAWIEMVIKKDMLSIVIVAPVRERGLKYLNYNLPTKQKHVAPVRERGLK